MSPFVLISAYFFDLILGDPQWLPHPVRLMGRFISWLEALFRRAGSSTGWLRVAGMLMALLVCAAAYLGTSFLIQGFTGISWILGAACAAFLAYTTLATRDLHVETRKVLRALEEGDLTQARRELSFLVGRDTAHLDEPEVLRALVETIGENISDGVVAPLFYLGIGGPAWAMTYKAVNTLDSMVGYKNERFRDLGWASARLDDAANFLPARISGLLIVLASFTLRKPWRDSWRILMRDHGQHESPNSGWPEAAMAGALGVRLGGLNDCFGRPSPKPFIGNFKREIERKDVREAWKILYLASFLMLLVALGQARILGRFFNL